MISSTVKSNSLLCSKNSPKSESENVSVSSVLCMSIFGSLIVSLVGCPIFSCEFAGKVEAHAVDASAAVRNREEIPLSCLSTPRIEKHQTPKQVSEQF